MPPDRLAVGKVWHRRGGPRPHAFRYRLGMTLIDPAKIEQRFSASRLWSVDRPNLVTLRRSDYIGPSESPIEEAVRDRVESELGFRPGGTVRMLTHLRQWGTCFNPVTFYFCERSGGGDLDAIVAEVHNTPWGERHAYALDARAQHGPDFRFEFDKRFHVSPFLPMAMRYQWRFGYRPDRIDVHMRVMEGRRESLAVGMRLELSELDARAMRRMPWRFPAMTARVVIGIYFQAFRLWLKRTPFFTHPAKQPQHGTR
ncbi:MAG: DUF1365 domain-containing protein [Candidatus Wenzhouxiangella sp. M2_3B_020]